MIATAVGVRRDDSMLLAPSDVTTTLRGSPVLTATCSMPSAVAAITTYTITDTATHNTVTAVESLRASTLRHAYASGREADI